MEKIKKGKPGTNDLEREKRMRWILIVFTMMIGCAQVPVNSDKKAEKIATGLKFAEGPAWSSRGVLYISNCYGDWITQIKENIVDTFVVQPTYPDSFSNTNGLTMGQDNYLYACDFGIGAILRFSSQGECTIYADGYQNKRFNRPNDLAFDPAGNLYFTDPNNYDRSNRDGAVYRIDRETGEVGRVADSLAFPNGIAFDTGAKNLYVCESAMNRVLKFEILGSDKLAKPEVFAELPGGDPDGIAFDRSGNLYVAHFGTGTVFIIDQEGKIISEIKTPGKKTTNVEFGGADYKTLFITDADSNAVYKIETNIPGMKLFYTD
jgi:gluconolactonase